MYVTWDEVLTENVRRFSIHIHHPLRFIFIKLDGYKLEGDCLGTLKRPGICP